MTQLFPKTPPVGKALDPTRPTPSMRNALALRRSAGKNTLAAPGPSRQVLQEILQVASRVPDHRRVEPWRFIIFEGDQRIAAGQALADIHAEEDTAVSPSDLEEDRRRFLRAPTVITIVSSPDMAHKTPVWEQQLSAGALCQNLLLAANAAGFAGVWLTEWMAYSPGVAKRLALRGEERIAGFIYLGTSKAWPPERPRPDLSELTTYWDGGNDPHTA